MKLFFFLANHREYLNEIIINKQERKRREEKLQVKTSLNVCSCLVLRKEEIINMEVTKLVKNNICFDN